MNEIILNKIKEAREKDPRKTMTVSDKLVKLQEEVGEIAAAHMKQLGFKPGEDIRTIRKNKKEEYADALIVIYDLILADKFTFEEIQQEMLLGIDKWHNKLLKFLNNKEKKQEVISDTTDSNLQKTNPVKIEPVSDVVDLDESNQNSKILKMTEYIFNTTLMTYRNLKPWLLFFYSSTCPPCKISRPFLNQFSVEYEGKLFVADVDANDLNCRALYDKFQIEQTPVFVLLKDGNFVAKHIGQINSFEQIEEFIKANLD